MKRTLIISIWLNVILLGGMLLLWRCPRVVTIPAAAPTAARIELDKSPAPSVVEAGPFYWSQLMSTNGYRSFVANLRAAGCPESTVEDIVRGDTGRAYSVMRERLGVNATASGLWSSEAQMRMVAYFLGQAPAPMAKDLAGRQSPAGATPPLVLQNIDLSTLKLNDAETQAIASIRETFLDSVGSDDQDTNDPAYAARWQKAQAQADTMLQAMLGEQDFVQYQLKAYQLSLQSQGTPEGN